MTDSQFIEKCLKYHNTLRSLHNAPDLVIDIKLNDFAQEWALTLAEKDSLEHRPENAYGENLYFGYDSDPNFQLEAQVAVQSWYDEISAYKFGEASPENLSAVGHFTQLVWKESQRLGVGLAKNEAGKIYMVCNYDPPGNLVGAFPENVEAPRKEPGVSDAPETVDSFAGEGEECNEDDLTVCSFDINAFLAGLDKIPPEEVRIWLDWLSKVVDAALEDWQKWLFAHINLVFRLNQYLAEARSELEKLECPAPSVTNVSTEMSENPIDLDIEKSASSLLSATEKEKSVVNYDPQERPAEVAKSKSTVVSLPVSEKDASPKRSPSAPSEVATVASVSGESVRRYDTIPIPRDQEEMYDFIREFTRRARRYELLYKYWLATSNRVIEAILERSTCDGPVEEDYECPYFFYLREEADIDVEDSDWGGPDEDGNQWLTCGNLRLYFNFNRDMDDQSDSEAID